MNLDITGSLARETAPLSLEVLGSLTGGLTGSSAVDTVAGSVAALPNLLLNFVASFFGDLGSTNGLVG